MITVQFLVEINATSESVWRILWQDQTFRLWVGIIDPGTRLIGELIEGSEVQFISGSGYGVTSLVAKLIPYEYVLFKHLADTQNMGRMERDQEWTGGQESYSLKENDGITTLTATFDVPPEMIEYFKLKYPKALELVKELAEKK